MNALRFASSLAPLLTMLLVTTETAAQQRPEVSGPTAAVTAGHPLAAAAGAEVLRNGGNAIDAAITMAGVLSVVRPHMNGIGGDAFVIYREAKSGKVYALNGSGRAGRSATPEYMRTKGHERMPSSGIRTATVPGAVRAWSDALERFGTIRFADALRPAIGYAENGFVVSHKLSSDINGAIRAISSDAEMMRTFTVDGAAPAPGTILRQPELAASLRALADRGADEFYRGALARTIGTFVEREQGLFNVADLAAHTSTWTDPISTTYHGLRVFAFPPNSQGLALLMQLNMAERFDLKAMGHNTPDYLHTLVEIKKLAFAERDRYVSDPAFSQIPVERLISKSFAQELAGRVQPRAATTTAERDGQGDTVYMCAVDAEGNMVVMIQSLFDTFGSKRMVPGTGIVLHNRGAGFTLDQTHANVIAPGKRPYHTLSPAMVLREDGSPFMAIGTPGGDSQTQTILQVINNIHLFGMQPQFAVEAPRYRSYENGRLLIDAGIGEAAFARLRELGHDARPQQTPSAEMGSAQVILILDGMKRTGADLRREAYGIAW